MDFPEHLLSILPAQSRAKVESVLIERDAASAAYRAASAQEQEARREAGLLEARVRERLAMPGGVAVDEHPAAAVLAARRSASDAGEAERAAREARTFAPVEAARRRVELAARARERAAERRHDFAFLESVRLWLERAARLGIGRLEHCPVRPPKVKDPSAEVARLRSELEKLDAEWRAVEAAPVPPEILRRQALREIERIAAKGALTIRPDDRGGTPLHLERAIRIAHEAVRLPGDDAPGMALAGDGGGPLVVWLLRDHLRAEVDKIVAGLPQDGALGDGERDRRFAEIAQRRLEVERQEEALIVVAAAEGRVIPRRRDLDARAFLEIHEA